MTKLEFEAWALRHGYGRDRWGHYHKGERRFKLSSTSVRLESKAGSAGWVRLRSGYLSRLSLSEEDKLIGLAY